MAELQQFNSEINGLTQDVVKLRKSLEGVLEVSKKLDTEFQETGRDADKVAGSINTVNTNTKKLTTTEKELIRIQNASQKITKETALAQAQLTEKRRKYREEARKSLGVQKKSNGLFRSLKASILSAGAAFVGIGAAIALFSKAIGGAVRIVVDFEKQMDKVQAITGATGKEMRLLSDDAKRLGGTTTKTATEVGKLQEEFAKLGFSTKEILNATGATIALSEAAGSDLAEAAVVAGSTLRALGIDTSETQRVVDVMAKSFSSSGLDIEFFKESMKLVAPSAKATGRSLEEVTAQLGILADNGIKGSLAGTQLNRVFVELNKKGLSLDDAMNKVAVSSDKLGTATALVGDRGAKSLLILAENTDQTEKLQTALEGSAGAAQEMADIMRDNLAGDVTILKSAWEGFILSMEDGEGIFSRLSRGFIQGLTKMLVSMSSFKDKFIDAWDNISRSSSVFRTIISVIGNAVKLNFGIMIDGAKLVIEAFLSVGKVAKDVFTGNFKNIKATVSGSLDAIAGRAKDLGMNFVEAGTNIVDAFKGDSIDKFLIKSDDLAASTISATNKIKAFTTAQEVLAESSKQVTKAIKEEDDVLKKLGNDINAINLGLEKEMNLERIALSKELKDSKLRDLDEYQEAQEQAREDTKLVALDAANELFAVGSTLRERELADIDAQEQEKLKQAGDNEEERARIEAEFDKKRRAIARKQAVQDKIQGIFNAGINTAIGITKALAFGPPAGFILAAAVGALGLIQIANIAAKPLPAFAKGVKNFEGGPAKVGEKGTEIALTPLGAFLTPDHATDMYLPPGTDIIPNKESMQMLQGGVTEAKMDQMIREQQLTRSEMKKKPAIKQTTLTDQGLKKVHIANGSRTIWADTYIRK